MSANGRRAAIAGVYNTKQGRNLEGETTRGLIVEAVKGALADAGLTLDDVDGITSEQTASLIYDLRLGPAWQGSTFGVGMVTEAVRQSNTASPRSSCWSLRKPRNIATTNRRHRGRVRRTNSLPRGGCSPQRSSP